MLWYILWYLSGLALSYVYILLIRYHFNDFKDKGYCPTPASILGSVIWSVLGPVIFLYCCIVVVLMVLGHQGTNDFWHKPVCKSRGK